MSKQKNPLLHAFAHAIKHTEWKEQGFKLSNGVEFTICHNMPSTQGLSIDEALPNWLARTKDYTGQSFVDYIMSKYHMHGNFAMTKETWDAINDTK